MDTYYVNKQPQANGDHEVHRDGCRFMPSPLNRQYLGAFSSCYEAVQQARMYYLRSNGCAFCSLMCHTS
ncbi:hypothetical protein [Pseudomonas aeruginosa]|uniref:hypothetical protein n=1 Tax=Pseudomonas aeruginosa TaxID=287 RepID=UPI000A35D94A|nr:hypothetical protein [Pseudomonas aeruginosa]ELP1282597.1 hypothetical protein [Pseudomonas aeruginosa]MCT4840534.1 hypothetical protein [Pseudomonas aeruginosa]MDI2336522.1 hypothetical protein [Pseudomonas aeruginosa]MDI2371034.1 hypothetical protein [Pseudomonas aeruginosa]MDL4522840.1 hypothetical protein [Pseudomonas aeruginosa]